MFGAIYGAEGTPIEALDGVAREFSPRIERCGAREIVLDLAGLTRLFGDAQTIAQELRRTAADRGVRVRVAIAGTRTAARLLVRHRAGVTVIEPGTEAAALVPLPIDLLAPVVATAAVAPAGADRPAPPGQAMRVTPAPQANADPIAPKPTAQADPVLITLRRWGIRSCGELAALPPDEVASRLGRDGLAWQRAAQGDDPRPLVPAVPEERFEQALELEWPIEGLEPLSFVLGRLMEPLEVHLQRRDRGAAVLHVHLHLVTREVHSRSLELPAPMRDARTLRTLALLDLESHPPAAAIDRVTVAVDPTPGRVVQFSLLTRPLPSPEQLSTLLARLTALMGEGRCGAPAEVDSWQPGACAMKPFAPRDAVPQQRPPDDRDPRDHHRRSSAPASATRTTTPMPAALAPMRRDSSPADAAPQGSPPLVIALRRFRVPVPARVRVEHDRPVTVAIDRRGVSSGGPGGVAGLSGGTVQRCAGPWRTSGAWWMEGGSVGANPPATRPSQGTCAWDRDEWDVTLADGTYRVFRERGSDRWFVDGVVD